MEKTATISNSRNPYRVVSSTGPRKPNLIEVIGKRLLSGTSSGALRGAVCWSNLKMRLAHQKWESSQ